MNITLQLGWWLIPAILTGILWLYICAKGTLTPSGGNSWIPDFAPVFFGLLGICGTLVIWLLYFMAAFFFGIK